MKKLVITLEAQTNGGVRVEIDLNQSKQKWDPVDGAMVLQAIAVAMSGESDMDWRQILDVVKQLPDPGPDAPLAN